MTENVRGVTLRPMRLADVADVGDIWHQGWRDGHLEHVSEELIAARTEESFQTRAADRIADATVAVVDGTLAGFVMVVDDELEQMYVSANYRGTGVADTLIERAEQLIEENGYTRAWLAVVAGNARARRFYERSGWSDDGLFDYEAYTEDGRIAVPSHRYVKEFGKEGTYA